MRGLSPVVASGGHSSSRCAGLSLLRPLLLRSTGSRRAGSVAVAHGSSCSAACGIFPDQGSNLCPLHQQADSQPLRHQGSPSHALFMLGNIHRFWGWGHCTTGGGDYSTTAADPQNWFTLAFVCIFVIFSKIRIQICCLPLFNIAILKWRSILMLYLSEL